MRKNLGEQYHPQFFLASLGSGGLGVSLYMYLMFMVSHPGRPMANFEHIYPLLTDGNKTGSLLVAFVLLGILYFSYKHFRLLIWNFKEYKLFKQTKAYQQLRNSNGEVTLMAIPLTLGMTVNVLFILGGTFIPNLWSVIDYLLPFALMAFFAIGIYALSIFKSYFARFIIKGDLDFVNNNNLSHMLTIFAFSMLAVGFGAPAAMGNNLFVSVTGTIMAIFFASLAVILMILKMILGFDSIFKHGINKAGSPSLWIPIPILTILGITIVRLYNGVSHHIIHNPNPSPLPLFIVLTVFVSLQIMFGFVGYVVMKRIRYFEEMVHGEGKNPGSFALICPGVAFMVLGMFWIHWGFAKNGIVDQFSMIYFTLLIPFILVQLKTIQINYKLGKKLLYEPKTAYSGKRQYSA